MATLLERIIHRVRGYHSPTYAQMSGWERYEGMLPDFEKRIISATQDQKSRNAGPFGRRKINWIKPVVKA